MRTRAHDAEEAFDFAYLSSYLQYNDNDLQLLATAPTPDLVNALLQSINIKAEEFSQLKTDKLKLDVEFENAVQTAEKKAAIQKSTVARQSQDIDNLRKELANAQTAAEGLTSQLGASKGVASESTTEVETLRSRIETLESSKRDTLALLDSKTTEKDQLQADLSTQHGKLVSLRREFNDLEQRNQSLESLTSTQKFKESSLRSEIELLQKSNEWQQNELRTTSQEHAKFRKERNLTLGNVQRELEEVNATADALRASETSLRQRFNELQSKLEETFASNASIQEDHIRAEQSLREQIESSKRLATLQAQNAEVHKTQVKSLQAQLDEMKDQAAKEIGDLYAEIDNERNEKTKAERRLAELEVQMDRLEQQPQPSAPSTPLANASPRNLELAKGGRSLTHTQLYGQYVDMKQSLEREERRNAKLQSALDDLILDMEQKGPEIVEMRQEQERLEAEVLGFSRMLDEAIAGRDLAMRESQRLQSEASAAARETELLRQQLRDMSAQVKMLLVDIQSRDQGLDEMTPMERLELERAARGDDQLALENGSSTQYLISERLVIFRSVSDLQSKNEQLLRLTRELGERMEGEEAQAQARQSAAQVTEVEELRAQVDRYKDELQATATQIDSYMKERDMFRRMLQHRGTIAPDADMQTMFGSSIMPATPQRNGDGGTPRAKELDELNRVLKEQQTFFDQFRQEASGDRTLLKTQIDGLIRERSSLQADVGRLNSQVALASQRYELLQSNFSSLRSENTALQQRSQTLLEAATKQDLRTQPLVEELFEARTLSETLRNESVTSKAEKDLWKRVEARLQEDNKSLLEERSRLGKLVTDLQNLANERELTEQETRRRAQGRVDQLEAELVDVKRKLEQETDGTKKAYLRKEYEETQSRNRIDDLVKSLGTAREDLVAARTTRDQLQARAEEMRIDLRAAEDKLAALQPRATSIVNGSSATLDDVAVSDISAEQRLTIEIADLRRELELCRNELISAKEQIDQYKAIAQGTEEELINFNETSAQYREESDKLLAERDVSIERLQQQAQDLSAELATTNAELSDLRTRHDEASKSIDSQRLGLEAELSRLREDASQFDNAKHLYQEDLKAQAEIAQQAQQSYESELLKHADAARQLQGARQERDTLREEISGIRSEAQAAHNKLASEEESWSEQKDRLEGEIRELQRRKADGDNQNKLLHQQMETFSAELQTLRQGRTGQDAGPQDPVDDASGKLQEVITYLRREKEIVEVQYELSSQESKRLQQQLDHANSQLDELHFKLAEERKQNTARTANEASTTRLAQAIDELNTYRESAVTLRNDARQARDKLESTTQEVERLQDQLDPLRAKLDEVEADLEAKDGEIKLVTSDRDHWRDRTQAIISKYDRVYPVELEEMKKRAQDLIQQHEVTAQALEAATLERDDLKVSLQTIEAQLAEQEEIHKKAITERLDKFKEQAREQNRMQKTKIADGQAALAAAQADLTRVQAELDASNERLAELESAAAAPAETDEGEAKAQMATIAEQASTNELLQARVGELEAQVADLTAQAELSKSTATATAPESEESTSTIELLQTRIQELEAQVADLTAQIEALQATAKVPEAEQGEITEASTSELETVQQQLVAANLEIAGLRAQTAALESAKAAQSTPTTNNEAGDVAEMTDEQVNIMMKTNARVRQIVQNSIKKNVGKETERLSKALSDKDEEIVKLKEGIQASDGDEKTALLQRLEDAQKEKETAIASAVDAVEKKVKVQLSQKDIAQAKVAFVQKAASDTPQRAVSEVWEEAKKARPAPKAAAPNPAAASFTPAGPKTSSEAAGPDTTTAAAAADASSKTAAEPAKASGIPQLPRGPGGISIQGAARGARGGSRGGIASAGTKRAFDGAQANNTNNKRPRG